MEGEKKRGGSKGWGEKRKVEEDVKKAKESKKKKVRRD